VTEHGQVGDGHSSSLLQLSVNELGYQLTEKDFQLFRNIEPTEYLADLFHCDSQFGTPNLTQFSEVLLHCWWDYSCTPEFNTNQQSLCKIACVILFLCTA